MRFLLTAAFVLATFPAFADPDAAPAPTTATPPAPAADATTPAAAPDADKVICRRGAPPTGSFVMPKPECHTRAEWAAHPNGVGAGAGTGVTTYGSMNHGGQNGSEP
jgi:hypothetical protein